MAINYLNTVNLNQNQLEQAAIQNLTSDPASGVLGQVYYNTVNSELKICTTAGSPTGAVWTTVDADNITYDLSSAANATAGVDVILAGSDSSTDTVNIIGTANEVEIAQTATANKLQIGLPDDVTVGNDLTVSNDLTVDGELSVSDTSEFTGLVTASAGVAVTTGTLSAGASTAIDLGANRVTNIADPTAAQDAATKAYVDAATVGGLVYQGGYNAATNTPDLDSSPSSSIKKGWTYTVTADGTFFTEQVRVGDVLIAESDAPTALANWTTVQNNIDLASASQVGIGNVAPGEAIDVSYSSGTATVSVEDSSGTNKGAVSLEGGSGINVSYTNGHAIIYKDNNIFNAVRRSLDTTVPGNPGSVTRTVSGGTTTFTVATNSMGLGAASALDVKAEVISAAGQTVYADITRSGNVLSIIFTGTVNDGDYEVLMSATVSKG